MLIFQLAGEGGGSKKEGSTSGRLSRGSFLLEIPADAQ